MIGISVLLVDDHPLVRMGLRSLIEKSAGIEVVGEAGNGQEALQLARELNPDVMLLDLSMPGMNGVEVTQAANEEGLKVRILILSGHYDPYSIQELFSQGIYGYLLKDEAQDQIAEAIQGVARGERGWVSRQVASEMSLGLRVKGQLSSPLTDREKQVLRQIITGKTNQEIAFQLQISEKTVEKHLSTIYQKLGVVSRVEAAIIAVREGWS